MKNKFQVVSIIFLILAAIGIMFSSVVIFKIIITRPLAGYVLKAGKPTQFGEYTVQVDKIEGNKLYGIKVSSKDKRFQAESGEYTYLPEKNAIKFSLINGFADDYDPENPGEFHTLTFKRSIFTIKLKPSAKE